MKNELLVGVWAFYSEFSKNNYILENKCCGLGDDAFWGQNELSREGARKSVTFRTLDLIDDWDKLDAVLVFDYPEPIIYRDCPVSKDIVGRILEFKVPSFLVLQECSVVKPNNWDLKNHRNWSKIFTWNDDFVKHSTNYVKINTQPRITPESWWIRQVPPRFSTLIASHKKSVRINEGYSERIRCVQWFDTNMPDKLDLYGYGWDQFRLSDRFVTFQRINKFAPLLKTFGPRYKVWKGELASKWDIAHQYKFHFAYENGVNISGYIIEKMIDAFLLCSVPIYLGANNVEQHINENCFIDFRNFKNYNELFHFLNTMSDSEYFTYLENIKKFIEGPQYYQFTSEHYTNTILQAITAEVQK